MMTVRCLFLCMFTDLAEALFRAQLLEQLKGNAGQARRQAKRAIWPAVSGIVREWLDCHRTGTVTPTSSGAFISESSIQMRIARRCLRPCMPEHVADHRQALSL